MCHAGDHVQPPLSILANMRLLRRFASLAMTRSYSIQKMHEQICMGIFCKNMFEPKTEPFASYQ